MWWIYALLSALFAALTALFAKIGIKGVDTDLATAIRTVVVIILAWAIVSWICYFKALQLGKVSQVAPVDKLSVALAIILAAVFLGEAISLKTGIAAALIITGTLVLIF
jgi:transporter family protein